MNTAFIFKSSKLPSENTYMEDNEYQIDLKYDDDEGGFVAKIPALNNIAAFGETEEEALSNLKKIKRDYLKFLTANKKPIPKSDRN